jgi:hypothetical protein
MATLSCVTAPLDALNKAQIALRCVSQNGKSRLVLRTLVCSNRRRKGFKLNDHEALWKPSLEPSGSGVPSEKPAAVSL